MFVRREIVIDVNHNRLSVFEEHHCIEAIIFVVETLRMEDSLDEVAATVSDNTKCRKKVAVTKLSLSDIISSSAINKYLNVLVLVRSSLNISQIFDSVPPSDSIIVQTSKCLILSESFINKLLVSYLLSKSIAFLK